MATLYVENVPDDLYDALRKRAKSQRRSIAAEVLLLLESNLPTTKAIKRRRAFLRQLDEERVSSPAPKPEFGQPVSAVWPSPTPRLRDEGEIRSWLDSLAQFSDKIPKLPESISREWLYQEHD